MHDRYTKGDQDTLDRFKDASRKLLELQQPDRALRYNFP